MGKGNLETVLDETWKEKTSKRLIPLKRPTFDLVSDTSYINIFSKKIGINPSFLDGLNNKGVGYKHSLDAIIEHEIGHYFVMPHSLTIHLLEILALKDMVNQKGGDPNVRDSIINYFNDIAVNVNIIMQGNESSNNLSLIYKNMEDKNTELGKLLRAYYHSFAKNIDFGADFNDLDNYLKEKFDRLMSINFRPKNNVEITSNIIAFRHIIEGILDINYAPSCQGEYSSIVNASEEEKKKALRELVDILTPDDYIYAYKILNESGAKGSNAHNSSSGYSHEGGYVDTRKPDAALVDYYRNKALQYPVRIIGTPLANKETQKARLSEWNPSDGVRKMNPLRSGGKIIPGVTKRWVEDNYYTYGQKRKIPDSIIVIDSSGSMVEVSSGYSYAAIAAVSAAIQYMENGSKVDVINFSNTACVTKYENPNKVLEAILEYQGDSTNFPSKEVKQLLEEDKDRDLIIITDGIVDYGHITSFLDMVNIVNENGKKNRNSFIYISSGSSSPVSKLTNKYNNIRFHIVKDEESIPDLVLGDTSYEA